MAPSEIASNVSKKTRRRVRGGYHSEGYCREFGLLYEILDPKIFVPRVIHSDWNDRYKKSMSNNSKLIVSDFRMPYPSAPDKQYGHCPRCDSTELHVSRFKSFFEHAISRFILPYRCNICCTRFYRPFWFKVEPRRVNIHKHFVEKKSRTVATNNA